jgi:hypothetical protein
MSGSAGPENLDPRHRVAADAGADPPEELQPSCLLRQLELLDSAGVDGAFVYLRPKRRRACHSRLFTSAP